MKRIVRLTESDLTRIVRRVIMEQATATGVGPYPQPYKGVPGVTFLPIIYQSKDGKSVINDKMVFFQKGGNGYAINSKGDIMSCSGSDGRLPCTSDSSKPTMKWTLDNNPQTAMATKKKVLAYYFVGDKLRTV
jgi:hypothetical protein